LFLAFKLHLGGWRSGRRAFVWCASAHILQRHVFWVMSQEMSFVCFCTSFVVVVVVLL
jgi:hypothetical protein